jgi:hypothetical protein
MTAPLSRVVGRSPKEAQVCTLACGHLHEHGANDMDCTVTNHRCELCLRGVSPQVEAMAEEGLNVVDFGRLHTESMTGATARGQRLAAARDRAEDDEEV